MYKLIASDLDGTLLNDKKEISKEDIESIEKYIDMGYTFSFATGRPLKTARKFFECIKRDIPLILCNGALITTSISNRAIYEEPLGYDNLVKVCDKYKDVSSLIIWANDEMYSLKIDEYTDYYTRNLTYKPKVVDYKKLKNELITKMIILEDHDTLVKIKEEASILFPDLDFYFSDKFLLEVSKMGVSKKKGIEVLSKSLNIRLDECICVGDEENDIPMLKVSGLPISVKNAKDSVKEVTKYTTTVDNNNSPLTEIINKFILNK